MDSYAIEVAGIVGLIATAIVAFDRYLAERGRRIAAESDTAYWRDRAAVAEGHGAPGSRCPR